MPIYLYECRCGYEGKQYLGTDKEDLVLKCLRCGKGIVAKQIRDNRINIKEKDGVRGVLYDDKPKNAS